MTGEKKNVEKMNLPDSEFLSFLRRKVTDFKIEGSLSEETEREITFILNICSYKFFEGKNHHYDEKGFKEFQDKHNREKSLIDSFDKNVLIEPMLRDLKIMSARVEHFRNESKLLLLKLSDRDSKEITGKYNQWLNQTVSVLIIQLDELYNLINDEDL